MNNTPLAVFAVSWLVLSVLGISLFPSAYIEAVAYTSWAIAAVIGGIAYVPWKKKYDKFYNLK